MNEFTLNFNVTCYISNNLKLTMNITVAIEIIKALLLASKNIALVVPIKCYEVIVN